ncbi:bifunctional anthranilate synthase component I family protein/aminotransferase class IV [Georgenia subflava]|uniref:Bifunctional aminodeoxychorismate synthase component I/aminodeoxychorismate lyase n=1 Tax=Georgenia subflava TaxID=1622177 RepID=A0A6N7ECL3_9MICO|nr:bifunctional anthranilate synthase component I family protein/aminotransferase class IV [Georgenia subflava]MPV36162.1 bifunctional aminodeoxychorismate synthase component I/aminodeoxychorismate lyase [Georgenia subflava]
MRPTDTEVPELGTETSPTRLARALRDRPGLVVLVGDWCDGGAVIAFDPLTTLEPGADPFTTLTTDPLASSDPHPDRSPARPATDSPVELPAGSPPEPATDSQTVLPAGPQAELPADPRAEPAERTTTSPVLGGGWIGYLGYQLGSAVETLPAPPPRPAPLPDAHLGFYDCVLRRDASGRWLLEHLPGADPHRVENARAAVRHAAGTLADAAPPRGRPRADMSAAPENGRAQPYRVGPVTSDASGAEHAATVARAQAHIAAGDVYQVNVCRRLSADFSGDPLDLFCAGVETLRPRFGAFLRLPDGAVASLSPELFLRRTGRAVLTSPIKGTAALDADPAALSASGKDRAENVMIVDLMRNDLGRVAVPGTVSVDALARVQEHTGVRHLVSDVRATLRAGTDDGDLLRATFPPGSCTGAPKVRAMEIVNTLERSAREVYTGAVGYASPQGLVLNVAIRTFEFAAGRVWLGAGGGVVAESDPDDEAHETLVKALPLLAAVGARLDDALTAEWAGHLARRSERARRRPDLAAGTRPVAGSHPAGTSPLAGTDPAGTSPPAGPDLAADISPPVDTDPAGTSPPAGTDRSSTDPAGTDRSSTDPADMDSTVGVDPAAGVFTTMRVDDGVPVDLPAHLGRLSRSAEVLYRRPLPEDVVDRVRTAAAELGSHRLRVDAAPAGDDLRIDLSWAPLPAGPPAPWRLTPVVLPGGMGAHKWADRSRLDLPSPDGAPWTASHEPLLVDVDGSVLETGRANIYLVDADGTVRTPALDGRLLPGVTRARALAVLAEADVPVVEGRLSLPDLAGAREVFVTNAVIGALPVVAVGGIGAWPPGPVAKLLAEHLRSSATAHT